MRRLGQVFTVTALAAAALAAPAAAPWAQQPQPQQTQPAPAPAAPPAAAPAEAPAAGPGGNGPIDVTSDSLETIDSKHLLIYHDNVEAVQNGNRLVCDVLYVYFTGKPAAGAAPAKPAPKPAAGAQNGAAASGVGSDWGTVDHLVAEGHVYFVGQGQTARGEHGLYEVGPDLLTLTGDVVVVQGDNVARGDKLVIHVKDNHSQFFSNVTGRNKPGRVRTVIYNNGQTQTGAAPQAGQPQPPAKAPAKP